MIAFICILLIISFIAIPMLHLAQVGGIHRQLRLVESSGEISQEQREQIETRLDKEIRTVQRNLEIILLISNAIVAGLMVIISRKSVRKAGQLYP